MDTIHTAQKLADQQKVSARGSNGHVRLNVTVPGLELETSLDEPTAYAFMSQFATAMGEAFGWTVDGKVGAR